MLPNDTLPNDKYINEIDQNDQITMKNEIDQNDI
jgi:hypothetical protein